MRLMLLCISVAALAMLYHLPEKASYVKLAEVGLHNGEKVSTSGFISRGKICHGKTCVKVAGVKMTGSTAIAGDLVKRNGESVLFVKRIE